MAQVTILESFTAMAAPTGAANTSVTGERTRPIHPLKLSSSTGPRASCAGVMISKIISRPKCNNYRTPPMKRERGAGAATPPTTSPPRVLERNSRRALGNSWASTIVAALAVLLLCDRVGIAKAVCPNMCSGHGECGLENVCECEAGWDLIADCSLKECPTGVSWGSKVRCQRSERYSNSNCARCLCMGRLSSRQTKTLVRADHSVLWQHRPLDCCPERGPNVNNQRVRLTSCWCAARVPPPPFCNLLFVTARCGFALLMVSYRRTKRTWHTRLWSALTWEFATGPWAPVRVPRATRVPRANVLTAQTTAREGESASPSARYCKGIVWRFRVLLRMRIPKKKGEYCFQKNCENIMSGPRGNYRGHSRKKINPTHGRQCSSKSLS